MRTQLNVVGAGLSGLVAAVTAAEAGADVTVYERSAMPGGVADIVDDDGRDGGLDRTYVCDPGPHVLFADGVLWRWFAARGLLPELSALPWASRRFVRDGELHRAPHPRTLAAAAGLAAMSRRTVPPDRAFAEWARRRIGTASADDLARLATSVTWHRSPGTLPADRVWERLRRLLAVPAVTWTVRDGWRKLADNLAAYAQSLGVLVAVDHTVAPENMTPRPTVLAVDVATASDLVGHDLSHGPDTTRIVCVDVGVRRRDDDPVHVTDITADATIPAAVVVTRPSATSTHRAPYGRDLLQAALPVDSSVSHADAVARIETTLDVAFPRWRERSTWRRERVLHCGDRAIATTVDAGDGVFVAGEYGDAPGMLAEVAVNSAVQATRGALDWATRLLAPEGWPAAVRDSVARLHEIASTLPAVGVAETVVDAPFDTVWREQPADEAEPGLRLRVDTTGVAGRITGVAAVPDDAGRTRVAVLVGTRASGTSRLAPVLQRLAQHEIAAIRRRSHT